MRILHLALQAVYNEGWAYQENLLTKYHVKLGHNVTLITTTVQNCPNGNFETISPCDYISADGYRVIRINYVHYFPKKLANAYKIHKIYHLLNEIQPDFIMIHGLGSFSMPQVAKYARKHRNCIVIADNHLDYNIGAPLIKKSLGITLYRTTMRLMNRKMQKYFSVVYGVTPWRCEFAHDVLGIPDHLLDVLPAGADDDKIDFENRDLISAEIRKKHNINPNDFLIITGGKIDKKKNIHLLMDAVSQLKQDNIKLIVFGSPSTDIVDIFNQLVQSDNIIHIGWISSEETYQYFLAADLVFFPGQHSVMWEQAVACGTPCVFKHYHAMHHCDIGGNCKFLYEDSVDCIRDLICEIIKPDNYSRMLLAARSELSKQFLYSQLAQKTLEITKGKQP